MRMDKLTTKFQFPQKKKQMNGGNPMISTRILGILACCVVLLWTGADLSAEGTGTWTLDKALNRIDEGTRNFRDGSGKVEARHVEAGKDSVATGSGMIYLDSRGKMRIEIADPSKNVILCTDKEQQIFKPESSTVEIYKLNDHPEQLAPYAMLGFLTTGTDLQEPFLMTLIEETTENDRKVLLLELVPRADNVRNKISRIRLWIDQGSWLPVRQTIFHTVADTYLDVTYSGFATNTGLDPDLFKDNWPKGTVKVKK